MALDTTTPAGRFQMQILGVVAEFERGMIRERVMTGLARAKAQRMAATIWGCSKSTAGERLSKGRLPPTGQTLDSDVQI